MFLLSCRSILPAAFKTAFENAAAAANNGVSVPLEVIGIEVLPQPKLTVCLHPLRPCLVWLIAAMQVVCADAQVGIQGDTFVAGKYFDLKTLGAANGEVAFQWEKQSATWVCTKSWSKQHVARLLTDAVRTHMHELNVKVA